MAPNSETVLLQQELTASMTSCNIAAQLCDSSATRQASAVWGTKPASDYSIPPGGSLPRDLIRVPLLDKHRTLTSFGKRQLRVWIN